MSAVLADVDNLIRMMQSSMLTWKKSRPKSLKRLNLIQKTLPNLMTSMRCVMTPILIHDGGENFLGPQGETDGRVIFG